VTTCLVTRSQCQEAVLRLALLRIGQTPEQSDQVVKRLQKVQQEYAARYPLADGSVTPEDLAAQTRANEKTLAAVVRERTMRQFAGQ
jgi:hypothetical protein